MSVVGTLHVALKSVPLPACRCGFCQPADLQGPETVHLNLCEHSSAAGHEVCAGCMYLFDATPEVSTMISRRRCF